MRTEVESKLLKWWEYNVQTQILTVAFLRGGIYNYLEFTPADLAEFQAAESKGKHFLKKIKPNFACEKLPPEENEDGQTAT